MIFMEILMGALLLIQLQMQAHAKLMGIQTEWNAHHHHARSIKDGPRGLSSNLIPAHCKPLAISIFLPRLAFENPASNATHFK